MLSIEPHERKLCNICGLGVADLNPTARTVFCIEYALLKCPDVTETILIGTKSGL